MRFLWAGEGWTRGHHRTAPAGRGRPAHCPAPPRRRRSAQLGCARLAGFGLVWPRSVRLGGARLRSVRFGSAMAWSLLLAVSALLAPAAPWAPSAEGNGAAGWAGAARLGSALLGAAGTLRAAARGWAEQGRGSR